MFAESRRSRVTLGALVAVISVSVWAKDKDKTVDRADFEENISRAKAALETFKTDDPGLEEHLTDAVGYAVFPNIGKGAFVVGAANGEGILFENGMPTGAAKLTQVSVGAQVGGQSYSELIIFKDQTALNDFKDGKFAVSSDASAVAGGTGASASLRYSRGVAVMTRAKDGLMAEAAVGGQKFTFKPFAGAARRVPKT